MWDEPAMILGAGRGAHIGASERQQRGDSGHGGETGAPGRRRQSVGLHGPWPPLGSVPSSRGAQSSVFAATLKMNR